MYLNKGAECYSKLANKTGIEDASPHRLISLLFMNAQNSLQQALGFMERKNFEGRANQLGRVITILSGLQALLDHEKGGEIAHNLDRLYEYMLLRINDATMDNSPEAVKEVISLLSEIQAGWDGIAAEAQKQFEAQAISQ